MLGVSCQTVVKISVGVLLSLPCISTSEDKTVVRVVVDLLHQSVSIKTVEGPASWHLHQTYLCLFPPTSFILTQAISPLSFNSHRRAKAMFTARIIDMLCKQRRVFGSNGGALLGFPCSRYKAAYEKCAKNTPLMGSSTPISAPLPPEITKKGFCRCLQQHGIINVR